MITKKKWIKDPKIARKLNKNNIVGEKTDWIQVEYEVKDDGILTLEKLQEAINEVHQRALTPSIIIMSPKSYAQLCNESGYISFSKVMGLDIKVDNYCNGNLYIK